MHRIVIVSLVSLISFAAVAAVPSIPRGQWWYAGGEAQKAKVHKTVDAIVDDMSFVMRPIARPRLKKECAPWKRLRIDSDGTKVTVVNDDGTFTTPVGSTAKVETGDGKVNVKRWVRDGVLSEKIWTKRGSRSNVYYHRGDNMLVVSTIEAPQLPKPIKFRYTYR